jgi:hypothetical protein
LVAGIGDFERPNARAVIDSRELIEALSGPSDALEELHVQLQAMIGLWLFVTLPGSLSRLTLLVCRQPVQSVTDQNAVHGGACNGQLVKAPQISGDPAWPKVVALSKVKNLGSNLARRSSRGMQRYAGPVA